MQPVMHPEMQLENATGYAIGYARPKLFPYIYNVVLIISPTDAQGTKQIKAPLGALQTQYNCLVNPPPNKQQIAGEKSLPI